MMTYKLLFLGLIVSFLILGVAIVLIKKNKLSEEYSSIWIILSFVIVLATLFSNQILSLYSKIKGQEGTGPEVLLFFSLIFVVFFLIFLSVKLSTYKKRIVRLTQEVALLNEKVGSYPNKHP